MAQETLDQPKAPPAGIVAERNTDLYDMVRFWGRKPHNLVREYIEHYTEQGEVVLDPFGGCGVAAIEALKARRRAVYNDLNKYARFIARTSAVPVDTGAVNHAFDDVIEALQKGTHTVIGPNGPEDISFNWLYSTRCPECGAEATIIGVTFTKVYQLSKQVRSSESNGSASPLAGAEGKLADIALEALDIVAAQGPISHQELTSQVEIDARPEDITRAINKYLDDTGLLDVAGETPLEIDYLCESNKCGGTPASKKPDQADLQKLAQIDMMQPAYDYPQQQLVYPSGRKFATHRPGTDSVDSLFTRRNLIALSLLKKEIDEVVTDEEVRGTLLLSFGAILEHTSKMQRPNKKGWAVKNYIIHPIFYEQNVLPAFENRRTTVVHGKEEAWSEIGDYWQEGSAGEVARDEATAAFVQGDARALPLPEESIDYVFTDPEYGPAVQYYELSLMASSWLGFQNDWKREIVVNSKQGKDADEYRDMLADAFIEVYRVLKPNRYMTVTFHSREIKYWNALLYAIQVAGFEYVTAIYQVPQHEYTNWLYARNPGEMRGDVYVTFRRPGADRRVSTEQMEFRDIVESVLIPEARKVILLHDGQATYNQLARGMTLALLQLGLMHNARLVNLNYEEVLNNHFDRIGRSKIWRLGHEERYSPVDFIPLDRRIEWIVRSVFNERPNSTMSQILSAIFTILKNSRTPENDEIVSVLERLAEPRSNKEKPYWQKKEEPQPALLTPEMEILLPENMDMEDLDHDRVIAALARLGHKNFGYDVWVGDPEVRKNKQLLNCRTIADLAIPAMDKIALERMKNIDVIWLERGAVPVALIEVENTTNPRTGFVRMANVFQAVRHLRVKAFSILPDSKARKLPEIVREPSIRQLLVHQDVYYAPYSTIAALIDQQDYGDVTFEEFVEVCEPVRTDE